LVVTIPIFSWLIRKSRKGIGIGMQVKLNDSLKRFKDLVEKDLTGLCSSWSMLQDTYGDMVVDALLLEKPCFATQYNRLDSIVRMLEDLSAYPGNGLNFRKLYSAAMSHHKKLSAESNTPVVLKDALRWMLCFSAGHGSVPRGEHILRLSAVKHPKSPASVDRFERFLGGMGTQGKQILDSYRYIYQRDGGTTCKTHHIRTKLRDYGFRDAEQVSVFRELCENIFIRGKRVGGAEDGRYSEIRAQYRKLLGDTPSSVISRVSAVMTPLQRFVFSKCFGPVEVDVVSGLKEGMLSVVDDVARTIPMTVHNLARPYRKTLEVSPLPSDALQWKALHAISRSGIPTTSWTGGTKGASSIMCTRYDHAGVTNMLSNGKLDKEAGGLRGRLAALSDSVLNIVVTAEDIKKHSWLLDDKEIAVMHLQHVEGLRQKDISAQLGITQGAVSHRLSKARVKIRLLQDMGRIPSELEMCAFAAAYLYEGAVEDKGNSDPMRILSAMAKARGKQTLAASISGCSQPQVSVCMRKWRAKMDGVSVSPEHAVAWRFLEVTSSHPYAFQSVDLPHFPWKKGALSKQLSKQLKQYKAKRV
jgi:predicted transcriptional regulator